MLGSVDVGDPAEAGTTSSEAEELALAIPLVSPRLPRTREPSVAGVGLGARSVARDGSAAQSATASVAATANLADDDEVMTLTLPSPPAQSADEIDYAALVAEATALDVPRVVEGCALSL